MSDNVISLDQRCRDKASIVDPIMTLSAAEVAAKVAVARQAAVDQEERGRLHMVLVNATTQALDPDRSPRKTAWRLPVVSFGP
jgi:hypothetical protein